MNLQEKIIGNDRKPVLLTADEEVSLITSLKLWAVKEDWVSSIVVQGEGERVLTVNANHPSVPIEVNDFSVIIKMEKTIEKTVKESVWGWRFSLPK